MSETSRRAGLSPAETQSLTRLVRAWYGLHPGATHRVPVPLSAAELRQFCVWWLTLPTDLQDLTMQHLGQTWQHSPADALSLAQVLAWLGTQDPGRALRLLRDWGAEDDPALSRCA